MAVSKNNGTPKSSILIGFSIINHPFWGTPIFGNTHIFEPKQRGYIGTVTFPRVIRVVKYSEPFDSEKTSAGVLLLSTPVCKKSLF